MRMFAIVLASTLSMFAGVPSARSQDKPTLNQEGWIDDPKLQKLAPPQNVIVSEKGLQALFKAWKLGDDVPEIDFKKELVVVATDKGSGSFLSVVDKGNLKWNYGGPPKDKPGFSYLLRTVSREGVKTVNGKPLPKQ